VSFAPNVRLQIYLPCMKILLYVLLLAAISIAQAKQTDREFEGYKGEVRTVLTERADASIRRGKLFEMKRRKNEFIAFDASGMRTSYKMYHWESGVLFDSVTYKLIDGDRASVYENITTGKITGVLVEAPPAKPVKPSYLRYDYKLKYNYNDQGRIAEEAWWQSDGDLWLRYVYAYAENVRHESDYDDAGELNQKYAHLLNEKGETIEIITFDADHLEMVIGRDRYEYVTRDRLGNWTKRIEHESEDGFAAFKPRETKYRTITYY
jgi:hypothetical protein